MVDWEALIIGLAVFAGWGCLLVFGVLLVFRPEWTVQQRWFPNNKDYMRWRHERFRFAMDPDHVSTGYFRFMGIFLIVFVTVIPLGIWGGEIGQTIGEIFRGLFLLGGLLSAAAWTFLPWSVLRRMPWLTPGLPPNGEGLLGRRVIGALMLAVMGVLVYAAVEA